MTEAGPAAAKPAGLRSEGTEPEPGSDVSFRSPRLRRLRGAASWSRRAVLEVRNDPGRAVEPGLGRRELLCQWVVSQPSTGLRSTSLRHRGGARPDLRQKQHQEPDPHPGSKSRGLAECEARFANSAAPDVRWIRRDAAVICRPRPLRSATNHNLRLGPAGS